MKNMRDFAPHGEELAESDVLASIRQLLTDDRVDHPPPAGRSVSAGLLPDADMAEDQDAALRRRLTGTLRPDSCADGRELRPILGDTLRAAPAAAEKGGDRDLRDLVLAARQALEAGQMPGRLRLSSRQRIPATFEMVSPPLGEPDPAVDADPDPATDGSEGAAALPPPQAGMHSGAVSPVDMVSGDGAAATVASAVSASDHGTGDDAAQADKAAMGAADTAEDMPDLLTAMAQDAAPQLFAPDAGSGADAPDIRSLIRMIIRQELEGALGDRLSRNIHQLLRRELAAAMTEARGGDIWTLDGRG